MKTTANGKVSKARDYKQLREDILNDLSDSRHGTSKVVAFSYNCQCEKCRTLVDGLKKEIQSDSNHPMHGTQNGYNYLGCRCAKCTRKFFKKTYGYRREMNWKRIGIDFTWDQYLSMLSEQNNKCCVCGTPVSITGELEHNHENSKIRGITCHKCNIGISAVEKLSSLRCISFDQQILINNYLKRNS